MAWGGRRGMGLRVLVEQKMGTWHPPVTKLQTAAFPPENLNVLLPAPPCPSETGCDPQGLGFNSSPAVPRGLAKQLLVHSKDTEMRKRLLWHQLGSSVLQGWQDDSRMGSPRAGQSMNPLTGLLADP